MDVSDLEGEALFTTTGKDVWKMQAYWTGPTVTLKNLETGATEHFGIGGNTADQFIRLRPTQPGWGKV